MAFIRTGMEDLFRALGIRYRFILELLQMIQQEMQFPHNSGATLKFSKKYGTKINAH